MQCESRTGDDNGSVAEPSKDQSAQWTSADDDPRERVKTSTVSAVEIRQPADESTGAPLLAFHAFLAPGSTASPTCCVARRLYMRTLTFPHYNQSKKNTLFEHLIRLRSAHVSVACQSDMKGGNTSGFQFSSSRRNSMRLWNDTLRHWVVH